MKIFSIMTKNVKVVRQDDSVKKAVSIMNRYTIGSVVVVNANRTVGIITERDVLRRLVAKNKNAQKTKCKDIMSKPLKTIEAEESIEDAIEMMNENGIKKLIVTRGSTLVGILSATDIIKSGEKIERAGLRKLARFFPLSRPMRDAFA